MDRRWLLLGAGVAGAAMGAFVMVGMTPDTGDAVDGPAPVAPPVRPSPTADPFAVAPTDQVLPGSTVGQILAGEAPVVPELKITRPSEGIAVAPRGPDEVDRPPPPPGTPLAPDVIGVERLFQERREAVEACASAAPEPVDDRTSVMVAITLTDTGGKTAIGALQIANDPDNQFTGLATCVAGALQGATFASMPDARPRQVFWSVKL